MCQESKGMKKGEDIIEYGCSGWPKTQKFGNISFSFFIYLLKTNKLSIANSWVRYKNKPIIYAFNTRKRFCKILPQNAKANGN